MTHKNPKTMVLVAIAGFLAMFLAVNPANAGTAGRTVLIHNNTNATIVVYRSTGYATQHVSRQVIPPLTAKSLFNYLGRGKNTLRFVPECASVAGVEEISSIAKDVWVSGEETRRHEISIYPQEFGKHAMFDKPGSRCVAGKQKSGCGDLSGSWTQTIDNGDTSTWVLSRKAGGYRAEESGLGSAEGTATYRGGYLRIDWHTGDWAGYYQWAVGPDCRGGNGSLHFNRGPRSGQTQGTRVTRQ